LFLSAAMTLSATSSDPGSPADGSNRCGTALTSHTLPKTGPAAAPPPVPPFSIGKFRVEVFRVDFADSAYPVTLAEMDQANAKSRDFFRSNSRNALELEYHVYPEMLHAPGKASDYDHNSNVLEAWILAKVAALGMKKGTDYDILVACFPWAAVGYGGVTSGSGIFLNGWPAYTGPAHEHEMGHRLGLNHAHAINPIADMFGTPGDLACVSEYGNPYDVMGNSDVPEGHFTVGYKKLLGWTDSAEVLEVSKSGIYRIYAHDNAVHKGRLIAIRVASDTKPYAYWFEYRSLPAAARNGALCLFQGFYDSFAWRDQVAEDQMLFDATPRSKPEIWNDYKDAAFAVGMGFKDKYGSAAFKVVGLGNAAPGPDSWVDVQVTLPGESARLTSLRAASDGDWAAGKIFDFTGRPEPRLGRSPEGMSILVPAANRAGVRLVSMRRN